MTRRQQIREGLRQPPDCVWQWQVWCEKHRLPCWFETTPKNAVGQSHFYDEGGRPIRLVGKDTP